MFDSSSLPMSDTDVYVHVLVHRLHPALENSPDASQQSHVTYVVLIYCAVIDCMVINCVVITKFLMPSVNPK